MKNLKLLNLLLLLSVFALSSCGDDDPTNQDYIDTLAAGEWTLTSTTINGIERDYGGVLTDHTQTHSSCDVSLGACPGSNSYILELDNNGGTITGGSIFIYSINKALTTMTIDVTDIFSNGIPSACTSGCRTIFTIKEWADSKHVLEATDSNGNVIVRTMQRK